MGGEMLELVADLGPKPVASARLRSVNGVLRTLRVRPPRLLGARTPGLRVVLIELRPSEHGSGEILHRSGRRFQITVTPPSARTEAVAVLATLRATRRS